MSLLEKFSLKEKVFIITGGLGLLGRQHAEAIAEFDGNPVLLDLEGKKGFFHLAKGFSHLTSCW